MNKTEQHYENEWLSDIKEALQVINKEYPDIARIFNESTSEPFTDPISLEKIVSRLNILTELIDMRLQEEEDEQS